MAKRTNRTKTWLKPRPLWGAMLAVQAMQDGKPDGFASLFGPMTVMPEGDHLVLRVRDDRTGSIAKMHVGVCDVADAIRTLRSAVAVVAENVEAQSRIVGNLAQELECKQSPHAPSTTSTARSSGSKR